MTNSELPSNNVTPRAVLPFTQKFAFGIGDFGLNIYWQTASLYLLFFYTEYLMIPAAQAGLIYMAALIWDALLDPLIGLVVDRTRTRFGRYRPYLLFGAPLLAVAFVVLFAAPQFSLTFAMIIAGLVHLVFRTMYALVSVPYASMSAHLTRDAGERSDITGIRMIAATAAALLVSVATLPLVDALGGRGTGWMWLAALYGALASMILVGGALRLKETSHDEFGSAPDNHSTADKLRSQRHNWPLLIILAAVIIGAISGTFFQKTLLYYFKYILEREDLVGAAIGTSALVTALFVPVAVLLCRRVGKRNTWLLSLVPAIVGIGLWRFAYGEGLTLHFLALTIIGMGNAGFVVCFWSMIPDTVEYGEWKSGVRAESLVFGTTMLAQKAALGLAAGALGVTLSVIGFDSGQAMTDMTEQNLVNMMAIVPFACALITMALIYQYPISKALHQQITAEIERRTA